MHASGNARPHPSSMRYCTLACLLLCIAVVASGCKRTPKTPATAWASISSDDKRAFTPGADRDGDGVTDDRELELRSKPDNRDSDGDGYDDGFEDRTAEFGFDLIRADADRDRDGLTDAREAELKTRADSPDTDGDKWNDFDEVLNAYFGFDPRVPSPDTDFDGLTDALEARLGSSPDKVDSNGDGISDFMAYANDQPPNGPPLKGAQADMMGITYSQAMADALELIRKGGTFPVALAGELPYPKVTASLPAAGLRPSAALMQSALYNPHNSPGIYPTYAAIEQALYLLAQTFDGNPNKDLVRLYYWTQRTVESCDGRKPQPGRRIYAIKVSARPGDNEKEPEVAFLGVHHARELISGAATMRLLKTLTEGFSNDATIQGILEKREVWVIPVVNPNGYDLAIGNQVDWRKNTRGTKGQKRCGTDLNRNYAFEHVSLFSPAQRMTLPGAISNGIDPATGNLDTDSPQYPGEAPFSEVETQAVRGLAHSQFATKRKVEVDGLICGLSWHSFTGVVMHPITHTPIAPNTGVDPGHVGIFDSLTKGMAIATGYKDIQDDFPTTANLDGCGMSGYPSYGDAADWLYKDGKTFATSIESYSTMERGGCSIANNWAYNFYPTDAVKRDLVADNNVKAAISLLQECKGW
ncbi:M14 family zinc carboxypeptidase [Lysobacter sp. GCM10012299]|uniref:M14 family zinc carboxypeptidase n=1 Tax=Lysobacter sp. GCM10012299 TaxID=3317333 RepID=UPI0036183A7C